MGGKEIYSGRARVKLFVSGYGNDRVTSSWEAVSSNDEVNL